MVVPIIALRIDLQARCTKLGIRCATWISRQPADDVSIVLVTPEAAITPDFQTFVRRQHTLSRLDRIVIDESHILIQPRNIDPKTRSSFRPMIKQLGQFLTLGVQVLLLTATLPPSLEYRLCRSLRVSRAQIHLHRSRTTRANLAYYVWRPLVPREFSGGSAWLTMPSTLEFVRERIRLASPGRTVIYTTTTDDVEALASHLRCEAFHSKSYDKDGILERFQAGQGKVLVATGSFGVGIDISDIRCVLHLGWPRSLIDYGQESGRAGRDRVPAEAIFIQPAGQDRPPIWFQPDAQLSATEIQEHEADLDVVRQYLTASSVCRRVLLDEYLDGPPEGLFLEPLVRQGRRTSCRETSNGSLPDEARCDQCDPEWYHRTKSALPLQARLDQHPHIVAIVPPPPTAQGTKRQRDEATSPPSRSQRTRPSANASKQDLTTDPITSSQFWHAVYPRPSVHPPTLTHAEPSRRTIADSQPKSPASSVAPSSSSSNAGSFESQAPFAASYPELHAEAIVRSQHSLDHIGVRILSDRPLERSPTPTSDPVLAEDSIPLIVRHQFRTQDQSRAELGLQWHGETESALVDEEFLDQEAHRWKDCCWTCYIQRRDYDHDLYNCHYPDNASARLWYLTWRNKIKQARMCACYGCGLPQTLCQAWDRTKVPQIECSAKYVLLPMFAMMMYSSLDSLGARRRTVLQIQRDSWQSRLRALELDPDEPEVVVRYLGQEAPHPTYRQTQLAAAFTWLRQKLSRAGVECFEDTET